MTEIWWSVYNRKEYPPVSYGFAITKGGLCTKANDKVNWMIGRDIEFIKKFFEDKPCDLTCINDLIKYENSAPDTKEEVL